MSEWKFVTAAYALTWVVLVAYGVYLSARVRRARAALRRAGAQAEEAR